jgi:hypothetical protein
MINGNACFAYFNKIRGIPKCDAEFLDNQLGIANRPRLACAESIGAATQLPR